MKEVAWGHPPSTNEERTPSHLTTSNTNTNGGGAPAYVPPPRHAALRDEGGINYANVHSMQDFPPLPASVTNSPKKTMGELGTPPRSGAASVVIPPGASSASLQLRDKPLGSSALLFGDVSDDVII